jgi:hypothetical protein
VFSTCGLRRTLSLTRLSGCGGALFSHSDSADKDQFPLNTDAAGSVAVRLVGKDSGDGWVRTGKAATVGGVRPVGDELVEVGWLGVRATEAVDPDWRDRSDAGQRPVVDQPQLFREVLPGRTGAGDHAGGGLVPLSRQRLGREV